MRLGWTSACRPAGGRGIPRLPASGRAPYPDLSATATEPLYEPAVLTFTVVTQHTAGQRQQPFRRRVDHPRSWPTHVPHPGRRPPDPRPFPTPVSNGHNATPPSGRTLSGAMSGLPDG